MRASPFLDAGGLEVLQVHEPLGGRRRGRDGADLGHERGHPVERRQIHFAPARQHVLVGLEIGRKDLGRDRRRHAAGFHNDPGDFVTVLGFVHEAVGGRHGAHVANQRVLVALAPAAPRHVDVEDQVGPRLIGEGEPRKAVLDRGKVLGLTHRHGGAFARPQALETRGGADHDLGGEIRHLDMLEREQPQARQGDGVAGRREAERASLEVREALDLGPRDQAVDRIAGLAHDRHRIGALEHRLDQVGRGVLAGIDLALVERGDDPVGAALDGNHHQIDAFAGEEILALRDRERQRRQAGGAGRVLPVAQRDRLVAAGGAGQARAKKRGQQQDSTVHDSSRQMRVF
jgi:hypothetical protein